VLLPLFAIERLVFIKVSPPKIHNWWRRVFFTFITLKIVDHAVLIYLFSAIIFAQWQIGYLTELQNFWKSTSPFLMWPSLILVFTFANYWCHRIHHSNNFLWLHSHQLHHSSRRFDLSIVFYMNPLNVLLNSIFEYSALFLCGFSLKNCLEMGAFKVLANLYTHFNIRTPQWSGYILSRPEQHRNHHAVHDHNFGILAIWDIILGTFKNIETPDFEVGFHPETDFQFWPMLMGHPVKTERK
jgi:sterol desaturase/sphingolipid hydroxylase (fatty acid hydroxylase superfamily)